MPAARRALTGRPVRPGPAGILRAGGAVMVLGTAAVAGVTAARVRRLRRSAAAHAHDLDHRAVVGSGPGEPVRLLVLGDSAARGYGLEEAAQAYPQQVARQLAAATGRRVDVRATATDGHRTADVLAEQLPLVRAARPDAVVVSVGVNDAVRGTRGTALRAATRALLAGVLADSDGAVVVLVTCPDLAAAPGPPWPVGPLLGRRCGHVRRVQAAMAEALDVPTVALPAPGRDLFGVDGFHPGAAGHAAMAERTVAAVLAVAVDRLDETTSPA